LAHPCSCRAGAALPIAALPLLACFRHFPHSHALTPQWFPPRAFASTSPAIRHIDCNRPPAPVSFWAGVVCSAYRAACSFLLNLGTVLHVRVACSNCKCQTAVLKVASNMA
jgi:hypothetical protein